MYYIQKLSRTSESTPRAGRVPHSCTRTCRPPFLTPQSPGPGCASSPGERQRKDGGREQTWHQRESMKKNPAGRADNSFRKKMNSYWDSRHVCSLQNSRAGWGAGGIGVVPGMSIKRFFWLLDSRPEYLTGPL